MANVQINNAGINGSAIPNVSGLIAGTDGTNLQPLSSDTLGKLQISDIINISGTQNALSVGTSSVEARVGGSPLVNRKSLTVFNNSSVIVYWGYTNAVTTVTGTPIYPNTPASWAIGPSVSVFLIASTASNDTRITEGA